MSNVISKNEVVHDERTIQVLDKGYVRLVDHMGSDKSVSDAARASYAKESKEFGPNDVKLIKFLARENHMSPFRHTFLTLEYKAPLMVARQHWKYVVGSDHTMDSWNEASYRYITSDTEFYLVGSDEWRSKPDNSKQGSGGPLGRFEGEMLTQALDDYQRQGQTLYNWALELEVAPEQARCFLPAYSLYVNYRWSCSLQSLAHFLRQRLSEDAQKEINQYALATYKLAAPIYPVCMKVLVNDVFNF